MEITPCYATDISLKESFMDPDQKTGLTCPIREVFLRRLWKEMVGMACESRYLFQADIPGFNQNMPGILEPGE
jgi:hypothetical protein